MSAIISACGKYRYRLERTVAMEGPVYAFFGVNPSTADANIDDATVRKWIGFVKTWGGSRFIVGNAFPYRATDVRELATCESPIGDFAIYAEHLKAIAADADILVPCWGRIDKVPKQLRSRFEAMLRALRGTGKPLMHFGLTACGSPKHPLMLAYSTPLMPFAATDKATEGPAP